MSIYAKLEKRTNYLNTKVGRRKAKLSNAIWVLWNILIFPISIAVILVDFAIIFVKTIKIGKFFNELHKSRIIDKLWYECDYDTYYKICDAIIFAYVRSMYDLDKKLTIVLDWPIKLICKERYKIDCAWAFAHALCNVCDIFDHIVG